MVTTLLSMLIFTPLGKPSANAVRVAEQVVEKAYTISDNVVISGAPAGAAVTVCALESSGEVSVPVIRQVESFAGQVPQTGLFATVSSEKSDDSVVMFVTHQPDKS